MKLFIIATVLGVAAAARLDNTYLPPRGNSGSGANIFGAAAGGSGFKAAGGFGGGSFGAQHSGNAYNAPAQSYQPQQQFGGSNNYKSNPNDVNAQIVRYNSDVKADSFSYDFETSNGIRADAAGVATNGVQSHGSFGYKGDDGQDYSITYTADENGYQPQGAHLPTPPPIPEEILKSLEQNARDEAAGIVDDGSYHGEGAGHGGNQGGYSGNQGGGYSGNQGGGYSGNQGGFTGNQGGHSGNQGGFSGNQGGFSGNQGGFSGNQGGFQKSQSNFGAANRQYLAPNAGNRGSGNGNFNQKSGYHY